MIQDLIEKYKMLLELRKSREALEARGLYRVPVQDASARRQDTKNLATRFPGALKELDYRTSSQLEARLNALLQALERGSVLPMWAQPVWDFHNLLSQALQVKAWLGSRAKKGLSLKLEPALVEQATGLQYSTWADAYNAASLLEVILNPPGSRLSHLVEQVLRERYKLSEAELRSILFGAPHG